MPRVPSRRRRALALVSSFTSPLLPDDYLDLVNPLWSTRELRGRIVRVQRECASTVTLWIKPGWRWAGHLPGQYLRVGVEVDGVLHWRAYSLTSAPDRDDGLIAITPKLVLGGAVSPYLCQRAQPGTIVRLGGVEGAFVLPDPPPRKLLMISAGSGITPIASMLRALARNRAGGDVHHLHSSRTREEVVFGAELRALAPRKLDGYRLHERITGEQGRIAPAQLDGLCPDWRERETFACGPADMLADLERHWQAHGEAQKLHVERFQPPTTFGEAAGGCGGSVRFLASGIDASADRPLPILQIGEQAGARLPHGCRMGICHSCVGRLHAGRVRDLRTGAVHGEPGQMLRTCVNAPEGAIEIEL
ncbi:MAG TPA: ferredoxin reductase [Solirubrobacteraceae bacterium]|jgi:ferredoxin-NADP reductase|nr:ferredoxin reductase [Solirubrobacteraceae bacterium]